MQASRPGTPLPGKAERRCRASASSSVRWDNSTSFLVGLKYVCLCQTVTNTETLEVFPRQGRPRALGEGQPPPEKGVICRSPTARTRTRSSLVPTPAGTCAHRAGAPAAPWPSPLGRDRAAPTPPAGSWPPWQTLAPTLPAQLPPCATQVTCMVAPSRPQRHLPIISGPATKPSARRPPADAQLQWAHTHFWRPPTSREDRPAQRHGDPRGSAGSVRPDTHQEM